ncbi:hypothetical protein PR202_gb13637 [Eleusine coracana subsp. coracana]|uniref:Uncharacterized protein n=1 Tax=Eleusine coracana subsp. coracana TaxID=191504 RepID=A0AAV5ET41_ELECO|nr:hypothetical protein QOZ80_9BG0717750 [Eleusine coracana subsp. coracana]GJN25766.1 hypothetical protein PR202_gb13637 [Eleusine coracana subsp. coracana]
MADVVFGSAKGAVDSLLGRITTVLADEAKLLASVRGEVRFLKDEMESMNGFLLHLTKNTPPGGEDHDDQVRAWMGQVRDLAYASEICIDMYIQDLGTGGNRGKGFLPYLWRLPWLVRTMPARHRIVTQIRELKARALEVGERRQRYGVTVPAAGNTEGAQGRRLRAGQGYDAANKHSRDSRRRALLDLDLDLDEEEPDDFARAEPDFLTKDADRLVSLLTKERSSDDVSPRVFPIVGMGGMGKTTLAVRVYRHPSVASFFQYKAWITVGIQEFDQNQLIKDITEQVLTQRTHNADMEETLSFERHVERLKEHLRGKSVLIVLDDVWIDWQALQSFLGGISSQTSCILTTRITRIAAQCSPYEIIRISPPEYAESFELFKKLPNQTFCSNHILLDKAVYLLGGKDELKPLLDSIISSKIKDNISGRLFLGLLYSNPSWVQEDLDKFAHTLDRFGMFLFCYNDLPYHYKTCLSYLSIFPQGGRIRRTNLIRRWLAENIVTKRDGFSALDEGERCFEELLTRGFLRADEFSVSDRVKICKIDPLVHETITKIAREEGTVDTSLRTPSLSYRLSIHKRIQQQQISKKKDTYFPCFNSRSDHALDDIIPFLEILPYCSQLSLLKVLDLEGCEGLKLYHIKNICNKMFQLKYLSLRNTGITQLPKEINKLQSLETLDIRQNKVSKFAAQAIMLPLLKHLLAGSTTICPTEDVINSAETFSTMHMPAGIGAMRHLQILSQIEVSRSDDELLELGQLDQLKKLGVVVKISKEKGGIPNFKHLLQAVAKLNKCLRSLSVSIEVLADGIDKPYLDMTADIFTPPKLLQSLHIRGITSGLPIWILELTQLTKITLRETYLSQYSVRMLGKLASLSCLRLLYKSYMEIKLCFEKGEFSSLKFLVIEGSQITNIIFAPESATNLEKIVWSFTSMQYLSGTDHLPSLKYVKLNGGQCDSEGLTKLRRDINAHPNGVIFKFNPPDDGQGSGQADGMN